MHMYIYICIHRYTHIHIYIFVYTGAFGREKCYTHNGFRDLRPPYLGTRMLAGYKQGSQSIDRSWGTEQPGHDN